MVFAKALSTWGRISMPHLTHFNKSGDAHMVDVGHKKTSIRTATAEGIILMTPSTLELIEAGGHNKGDVLGIARIAAIMAAKKTSELIPLCHPIHLTHVEVNFKIIKTPSAIQCSVTTKTIGQTGVEMEALTAVHIGLLTIYDMCKAVDKEMEMSDIHLMEKQGGRSGHWKRSRFSKDEKQ